jgi:Na+/glutamate symporter
VFSLLAQAAVHNSVPVWFGAATLGTVTGALLGGAWLRRWFEGGKVA